MDQIDLGALLADVAHDPRSLPIALATAVVVLVGLLRRRGARPRTGEIWFADVPFEEGSGSKDRPVLVLAVDGRTCTVARFTSQDKGARRDHLRVPAGIPGLNRTSWVSVRPMRLRRSAMRRRTGSPGAPLVSWYDRATGR
ncbi:type II toxin-antitoxin system PemK/MazF family toxin [Pengzhenrongella frigida]|uniref:Type II toxin-antitoxin system PemK/MazF family toxin n=1 Tax=Pengzhenrongella frigida TaxID=1259133 RepID=A0A4Q5N089_9MICO|nr:type II toxin-antitoxin system PemK/MazF family toxin [Cellulomonas sp. HLT2-17]RYV51426.1 hypothetical protein EUA98_08310 [Cellulomonas sp. HLT2-17]